MNGLATPAILAHLEEILGSPPFRSSLRSRQFLEYTVTHTLEGHTDLLKERVIGEKIFGRPADYDTGQDSIVRVKANEVRRRLSQFYDLHPHTPLRIDLPSGSYAVQFRQLAALVPEILPPAQQEEAIFGSRGKNRLLWAAALIFALVMAGAIGWMAFRPKPVALTAFDLFWKPFLSSNGPLTVCLPTPEVFRIYGSDRDLLVNAFRAREPGKPLPPLPPESQLSSVRILPETGLFLGLGDAHALSMVQALAAQHGKRPEIRLGNTTTFSELRSGPSVLIGGFTNHWTLDLMKNHRFEFVQDGHHYAIRDNYTRQNVCEKAAGWETPSPEDCAVVTRLIDSKTGHPLLIAAGLDHFGTLAVGEFVTEKKRLEQALQQAAKHWETKNLQIAFRVEKVRDSVGPTKGLVTHVW